MRMPEAEEFEFSAVSARFGKTLQGIEALPISPTRGGGRGARGKQLPEAGVANNAREKDGPRPKFKGQNAFEDEECCADSVATEAG